MLHTDLMRTAFAGSAICMASCAYCQTPAGAAMTYQGELRENNLPLNCIADLKFRLFDAPTAGHQICSTIQADGVSVVRGVFTVQIDFGAAAFNGDARWLQIDVRRPAGLGPFVNLAPRQRVTAVGYAIYALNAAAGAPGPTGPTGPQGASGAQGPTGPTGLVGGTGPMGPQGVAGPAGVAGAAGPAGPAGAPGPAGAQGSAGSPGPTGPQGPAGAAGAAGARGATGATGLAGASPFSLNGANAVYTAGNVGVGTTSPQYPLHVQTSGARAGYLYSSLTNGGSFGAFGRSDSTSGVGLVGLASATSGQAIGVQAQSESTAGRALLGWATATTGDTYGLWGLNSSNSGTGVVGHATSVLGLTTGVLGRVDSSSDEATAVYGGAWATSGVTTGVWGVVTSGTDGAAGVFGTSAAQSGENFGVFGSAESPDGYGVYCLGNFAASGTKAFRIDHPLDPQNKYLLHYSAEGPSPLNMYSGKVFLDNAGEAQVDLPDYFESVNRDATYHLTAVGGPAPNLHIARKEKGGKFEIAGGTPGLEVSWVVMGIRNDDWVRQNGAPVVTSKSAATRGKVQHPALLNQPKESGTFFRRRNHGPLVDEVAPTDQAAVAP